MIIHFVINPRAGTVRRARITQAIRRLFSGDTCVITPGLHRFKSGNTPERMDEGVKADMIVAVGGDGTVNRVINSLQDRCIPIGILPMGSSNDLAMSLGIPGDFDRACEVIQTGRRIEIDLISVNGSLYATCGGLGVAGDVAARANSWRKGRGVSSRFFRIMGRYVYPLAALRELSAKPAPLTGRIGDSSGIRTGNWFNLFISNQPRFGGFSASPSADNRDGLVNICEMAAPPGRLRMMWISLQTYLGRPHTCPEVRQHLARGVTVRTEEPVPFFGDGEILSRGRRFRIRVLPRALKVVVPRRTALREKAVKETDSRHCMEVLP